MYKYNCKNPIVLIIYNRPHFTEIVINRLTQIKISRIYVISDGPKDNNFDKINVQKCRDFIDNTNWHCEVYKLYSSNNLGCMNRIVSGLDEVFEKEETAIILEDDCIPDSVFFEFMDWGILTYQNTKTIGMISGSNLLENILEKQFQNNFSYLINVWGWATWRDRWLKHNPFPEKNDITLNTKNLTKEIGFSNWMSLFWRELFIFAIYKKSTWDFQLQYSFFKNNWLAVFPGKNLVDNIGFDGHGTHTNVSIPDYVVLNKPNNTSRLYLLKLSDNIIPIIKRDILYAKVVWKMSIWTMIKLYSRNILKIYK